MGWVFLGIIVALAIWAITIYNGLVALRNRFKNAFAQIDVQLKRRYDLIPNLVEVAKGYIKHERETLEAVIRARNVAVAAAQAAGANRGGAGTMQGLAQAEGALSGMLGMEARSLALSAGMLAVAMIVLSVALGRAQVRRAIVGTQNQG